MPSEYPARFTKSSRLTLCTSMIKFVLEPSGFVTLLRASADPLETKVSAEALGFVSLH